MNKPFKFRSAVYRLFSVCLLLASSALTPLCAQISTVTFSHTGSMQQFVIPNIGCTPNMTVELYGARGGSLTSSGAVPGNGGYVRGVLTATPGATLYISVGGQGSVTTGGFNGGGPGGVGINANGGGGGGATDIRLGLNTLSNRILVAGGGGGTGYISAASHFGGAGGGGSLCISPYGYGGGNGGGDCSVGVGGNCIGGISPYYGAAGNGGGLNSAGGISGAGSGAYGGPGALGTGGGGAGANGTYGGSNGSHGGGGGGGGYYGGSGASSGSVFCSGGGGGGSSFADLNYFSATSFSPGLNNGHGYAVISYSNSGPGIDIVASQTAICAGSSLSLAASGVNTYSWVGIGNSNSIVVSPSVNTIYTVTGTNSLACQATSTIQIFVSNASPTLNPVFSSTNICLGNTVTLSSGGAITYTWNGSWPNYVSVSPTVNTVYTVSGQNGCGSSATSVTVFVSPLSLTLSASSYSICQGESTTLTALGQANAFLWQSPNFSINQSSIIVTPSVNTAYSVSATDGTCIGSSSLPITVYTVPILIVSPSDSVEICKEDFVMLNVSGASSYTWQPIGFVGQQALLTPTISTSYTVIGQNPFNCISTKMVFVKVNYPPVIWTAASAYIICSGNNVTLTANGANTYTWNNSLAGQTLQVNPSLTTTYSVTGMNNFGCAATASLHLIVVNHIAQISGNSQMCIGTTATLLANPANTYQWNGGPLGFSTYTISPTSYTYYTLASTIHSLGINCTAYDTLHVSVNPLPVLSVIADHNPICFGEPVNLFAYGALTFTWSNNTIAPQIQVTPLSSIVYTVKGADANSCIGTGSIQVVLNECTVLGENDFSNAVYLFPNPSSGEFTIVSPEQQLTCIILDQLGRIVYNAEALSPSNLNYYKVKCTLPGGIYSLMLKGEKTYWQKKLYIE